MKRLLLAPLILILTATVQARPYGLKPALKVEQCTKATVQKVHTTWREPKHDPRAIIALSHDPKVSDLGLYLGYELREYEGKYWDYLGAHPPILTVVEALVMPSSEGCAAVPQRHRRGALSSPSGYLMACGLDHVATGVIS